MTKISLFVNEKKVTVHWPNGQSSDYENIENTQQKSSSVAISNAWPQRGKSSRFATSSANEFLLPPQSSSSLAFKVQLGHLIDQRFEVYAIETPNGANPSSHNRLPYTNEELAVILKALRFPKYSPKCFYPEQQEILEKLGFLSGLNFDKDMLKWIGERLYAALMVDDVNIAFQVALDQARSKNSITLQLRFDEKAVNLASYPWELLYFRRALLPSRAVELVRYVSYSEAITPLSVVPPLRLLYLRSRPVDLSELSHKFEQTTVYNVLQKLEKAGQLIINELQQPTYESLLNYMENSPVHILHFDGHGVFAKQCPECSKMNYPIYSVCLSCAHDISNIRAQGYLAFEDDTHQVDWISSEDLSTLFYNRQLRLIVLSACRTASVGGESLFSGMAPSLIQAGIPAVIATQLPISVEAACKFMQGFYSALARFEPLSAAMNAGRILIFRTSEWFIPTLYLRSQDEQGNLFLISED